MVNLPQPVVAEEAEWSAYFSKSFYHACLIPLLLATVALAYAARPSTNDPIPAKFRAFQWSYLAVWAFCVGADWLQGPFVYALYAAYGFSGREIAQLFVAGFGSSMVFGCFVGTFTDKFGRRQCCALYCILYILSCATKHFNNFHILMAGRITGGIATSMLFSCFECWLVSEHLQRHKFSGGLLGYMFGMMYTVMYCVAIGSGLAGQAVADAYPFQPISPGSMFYVGGFTAPFDLAIASLFIGMVLMAVMWPENYGNAFTEEGGPSMWENLSEAVNRLTFDPRTLLLCIIIAAFEGSMYAFVFNWTPALDSKTTPPPHGLIFALFMMSCMCGASTSTLADGFANSSNRLATAFGAALGSFILAAYARSFAGSMFSLQLTFAAFMLFEFCVGVYFPSIGVLKSEVVPEHIRGTTYNLYRVPLNGIVVALLLGDISLATCFRLNAALVLVALLSVMAVNGNFGVLPLGGALAGHKLTGEKAV